MNLPKSQTECPKCKSKEAYWFSTLEPSGRPYYHCNSCGHEFIGEGKV